MRIYLLYQLVSCLLAKMAHDKLTRQVYLLRLLDLVPFSLHEKAEQLVGSLWPFQRLGELQIQIDGEAKKAELVALCALISQNASRRVPYP